jgi:hypothetical protein
VSALNTFVVSRTSVVLVSDSAICCDQGILRGHMLKVVPLPGLRGAVGMLGGALSAPVFASLLLGRYATFDEMVGALESDIPDIHAEAKAICGNRARPPSGFLVICGWSAERASPEAYTTRVGIDDNGFEIDGSKNPEEYPEYRLAQGSQIMPFVSSETLAETGIHAPQITEAAFKNGLIALLKAQRKVLYRSSKGDYCRVGGNVIATTLTRHGVVQQIIHRWPDRIGERLGASEKIEPEAKAPMNMHGASSAPRATSEVVRDITGQQPTEAPAIAPGWTIASALQPMPAPGAFPSSPIFPNEPFAVQGNYPFSNEPFATEGAYPFTNEPFATQGNYPFWQRAICDRGTISFRQ